MASSADLTPCWRLPARGIESAIFRLRDLSETLTFPGFLRMAAKYWRTGLGEMWRSFSKRAFVRALQRLVPEIHAEHLRPAPSGVRAQAVVRDGTMVDDFLISGNRACSQRVQCAVAGGDRVAQYRPVDCREACQAWQNCGARLVRVDQMCSQLLLLRRCAWSFSVETAWTGPVPIRR